MEFPRKTNKNSCDISRGLDFLALKFPRDVKYIILPKFVELCFAWNFQRCKGKQKNVQGFFKKVCPQTPLFFFWKSLFQNNWLESFLWGTYPERSIHLMSRLSICIIFLCSTISIGFSKVHTYVLWCRLIGERSTPTWEGNPPSSPTFPIYIYIYIYVCVCCKYFIKGRGKSTAWLHFIYCF